MARPRSRGCYSQHMRFVVPLLLAVLPWSIALAGDAWSNRLPASAAISEHDGGWWWQPDGATPARLTGVDPEQRPLLATPAGTIAVHRALFADGGATALAALPALLARAADAQVAIDGAQLADGLLTGPQLRTADAIVLADAVLRRQDTPANERAGERQALAAACEELGKLLGDAGFDHLAQRVTVSFLGLLSRDRRLDGDDLEPAVARRLVRNGWLRRALPDLPAVAAVEQALATAGTPRPVSDWSGDGRRLAEWRDAFAAGGWTFTAPDRVAYARPHSRPENRDDFPNLILVVDLPAGADPLLAGEAVAARLHLGNQRLASWSREHGFAADGSLWRQVVPEATDDADLTDALPPHLVVSGFAGDALLLATAHGVLRPPADATPAAGQRFIAEAAAALPDAAHLDLIGEHLFTYAFDSPDTTRPLLVGNRADKGDIHQTAEQTTATCTGGCMRGDCDDLAELYRDIATAQKRIAHVLHLPGHAACAWVEKDGDSWNTYLLQTGPPLAFSGETLNDSLLATYQHFDPQWVTNPNQVPVALRFAGENTRSPYWVSARIFAEADYARVMIEVQRDWHFRTFHHAIATMMRLVEAGDRDAANLEELAGLYQRIGDPEEAAVWKRRCLEAPVTPLAKLGYRIDLVGLLVASGHPDEAEAEARIVLDHDLPALADDLGDAEQSQLRRLYGQLDPQHHAELRRTLLTEHLAPPVMERMAEVRTWIATKFDAEEWDGEEMRRFRDQASHLVDEVLDEIDTRGLPAATGDEQLQAWLPQIEGWLSDLVTVRDDDPAAASHAYADLASYYERMLGHQALRAMVLAIDPASATPAPLHRIGAGVAGVRVDLAGIRCSVPYWSWVMMGEVQDLANDADPAPALAHLVPLEAAFSRLRVLNQTSPFTEAIMRNAHLTAALLRRDVPALHGCLVELRRLDDRDSYDEAVATIAGLSRRLPPTWFTTVIGQWHEVVSQKPWALALAWESANAGADEQALIAARAAVAQYSDDQAFAEEFAFLSQTIEKRKRRTKKKD